MTSAPLIPASALSGTGDAAVVIGLSGGLDSVALLHALATLPEARARGVRAMHVHHGLHADADAWSRHCEAVCEVLEVPLRNVRIEVPRDSGEGLEAAARYARHAAFATELGEGEVLALAHHRDDQAETFLLRALRGSGVDGLGAMRAWRSFGRGWLWRPLLGHSRAQLLAYAEANDLRWVEDPSNSDTRFDRNFLRRQVQPLLRERWPHADATLARSAELSAQAAELLANEDARCLAQLRTADAHVIAREGLLALPAPRRARVLRRWMEELGLPPLPAEGIARVEAEVLHSRDDANPRFRWAEAEIRAWRDLVHAGRTRMPLPDDWSSEWDGTAPLSLPDDSHLLLLRAGGFDTPVRVHARQGGERIVLPGRDHSHALKHVLQDLGVPPWVRDRLPLLSDPGGELLAAGDLVFSAEFENRLRARNQRLIWTP